MYDSEEKLRDPKVPAFAMDYYSGFINFVAILLNGDERLNNLLIRLKNIGREANLEKCRGTILVLMHFLSMALSSRSKKRYILFWTENAVLLVLWACGDVEANPGPTENTSANTRSQILRSFRRRSQKDLVKLIYQKADVEIPKEIFKHRPPGWDVYKPEIEFGNISNLPTGSSCNLGSKEENIFSKIIHILQNKISVPLSSETESLLRHYNNLNTKIEQKESKKAIIRWLHEKKLTTMLQAYAEEVEDPSVEIRKTCLAIAQKSSNKEQALGIQGTKNYDYNDLKTFPYIHAEYNISHEKNTSKDIHNKLFLKNEEECDSEGAKRSDQEYLEDQDAKLKVCLQRKRRSHPVENESAPATKRIKRNKTDLVECQENRDGLNLSNSEENENYTVVNADAELLLTYLDNLFSSENSLGEKDLHVSPPEEEMQELSEDVDLPTDAKCNNDNSCDAIVCDSQQSTLTDNITETKTFTDINNDLIEIQRTMDMEEYLKCLGNRQPSAKMFQLCQDILKRKASL